MATIKSFTSLEQSKKLAEILPLESADMHYNNASIKGINYVDEYRAELMNYNRAIKVLSKYIINHLFEVIPCWSLAALLSLIPQEIFDGEYIINITEGCDNKWILTYDHFENRNHSYYGLSTGADNLVDACYKLILKLNELNLL